MLVKGDSFTIEPNIIHWASGNETWIEVESSPGWQSNDHILINWLGVMINQLPVEYKEVWDLAWQYQDARDDIGHAEVVTSFALKIAKTEQINSEVVILASILHDIGWSSLSEKERMLIFNKSSPKEERLKMRYKHQEEGEKLAKGILTKLNYKSEIIDEVCKIISEHDTREGFISANEGAMRDADKLWRFCQYGFNDDNRHSSTSKEENLNSLNAYLQNPQFFYFNSSRDIARKLLKKLSY